jgi:hypothetical protein
MDIFCSSDKRVLYGLNSKTTEIINNEKQSTVLGYDMIFFPVLVSNGYVTCNNQTDGLLLSDWLQFVRLNSVILNNQG